MVSGIENISPKETPGGIENGSETWNLLPGIGVSYLQAGIAASL
jgi:hypothetical protein